MSRTRRRIRPPDDPRVPRKFRQESGVNLMHEEPWFGFNVANKMPTRNATDPAGNPFLGLPANRLKFQDLTKDEMGTNEVDSRVLSNVSGQEAVGSGHVQTGAATKRWFGAADNPDIPTGVQVPVSQLRGAGNTVSPSLLPGLGAISGKVNIGGDNNQADIKNNAIKPKAHIDWTVKDTGFIPTAMLATRPWTSKTDPADVVRLIRKHVKQAALKPQ